MAAHREEEVLAALEAACRAQLLAEEEGHDSYQFTHDVIREVVEADVGAAREHLGAALAIFTRLDARQESEQVKQTLGSLQR